MAFLVAALTASGEAAASSFVVLEAATESLGPSMIALGEPAADQKASSPSIIALGSPAAGPAPENVAALAPDAPPFPAPSPSIVALGAPPPPAADEKVAAIPQEKKPARPLASIPMVIRGGLVGDAFTRPVEPDEVEAPEASGKATAANERPRRPPPARREETVAAPEPGPPDAPGPVER